MALRVEDIKQNLYVIVKNKNNDNVQQVVHLHDTKIGTSSVSKNLDVTGDVNISGEATVEFLSGSRGSFTSLSGSIQKTTNGLSYLVAGNGINIVSSSVGQIAISTSKDEIFSFARIGSVYAAASAGNFTVGGQFYATRNVTCSGVRFYWATANKTIKTQIWTNAGSSLASVSTAITSVGVYESVFSTSQNLTAGTLYKISAYQTDAANYTAAGPNSGSFPNRPFYAGGYLTYTMVNIYSAGDAVPASAAATEVYCIEPIFTI